MAGLVFTIEPSDATWTVVGPSADSAPYTVENPLADQGFVTSLVDLAAAGRIAIARGTADTEARVAAVLAQAAAVGERLTSALLSPAARVAVQRRMAEKDLGRARLSLRVAGRSERDNQVLA